MESYVLFNIGTIICIFMWGQTILQTGFSYAELSMIIYYICCATYDIYGYMLWRQMYRKGAINHKGFLFAKRKIKINKIIKLRRQYRNLHWDKDIDMYRNT